MGTRPLRLAVLLLVKAPRRLLRGDHDAYMDSLSSPGARGWLAGRLTRVFVPGSACKSQFTMRGFVFVSSSLEYVLHCE